MHTIMFEVKDHQVFSNKSEGLTRETAEKLHRKLVEKGINDMSVIETKSLTDKESSEFLFTFNNEKKLIIAKEILETL